MDRHHWAVDLLQLTGAEQIVEIGCGPGMATVAACMQLTTGSVTAIDRSDTALARAKKRAADALTTGRVQLEHSSLAELTAPRASFDKAFAINVNVFWTSPATTELAVLRRVLRLRGELHIVYETPWPEKANQVASQVSNRLSGNGFSDVQVIRAGSEFMSISGRRGETQ